ncbi:MAG: small multi-drug export protein [Endomicrobiales bacterium]|nr:small multi-drug export protein [Endomicrobiales bacterium]
MTHQLIESLKQIFSPELVVLILGSAPVSELRGAIPVALLTFGFSVPKAVALSVAGNLVPVVPLLLFLDYVSKLLMKHPLGRRFFTWWFERTRRQSKLVERYEVLGLILFVGIPLPITGAWSGCVAAYLLGIRFRHAFPAIVAGVLVSATIVTLMTMGILKIF